MLDMEKVYFLELIRSLRRMCPYPSDRRVDQGANAIADEDIAEHSIISVSKIESGK